MATMLSERLCFSVLWIFLVGWFGSSSGQSTENTGPVVRYVCNDILYPTPFGSSCYFLTPPINTHAIGTPRHLYPNVTGFSCNGTLSTSENPACIYLLPSGPNNQTQTTLTGYLAASVQYACNGAISPIYNPACTYSDPPVNNILTGVPLPDVPADPFYRFACKGRVRVVVDEECSYRTPAVERVFAGVGPVEFECNGTRGNVPNPQCLYTWQRDSYFGTLITGVGPVEFLCDGKVTDVPSPRCQYTWQVDHYVGTVITDSNDAVESYWLYMWIAVGVGGGIILILLIALSYFVCQYQKEHNHVRKLRAGNVTILEETVTRTSGNDVLSTEDETSFIDDIQTRSPPIALQTFKKDLPPGYPPAPELTNVRVPTDRHNRALDDSRRPGPSSASGDDRRRVRSPSGRKPRERYEYDDERPRKTSQAEPRPRRSQYDEEVSRYKFPRRREDEFETMSSEMPRNRDVRPAKKTRSIPDLDRIDEVDQNDRKRIPSNGWSYLPQAVDVYQGMPRAQPANTRDNRRERSSEKKDNRNDGFILRGRSADELDDRRSERTKSPAFDAEREWSRDAGNRRSRSSDVGGRRASEQKRDAYVRPYH